MRSPMNAVNQWAMTSVVFIIIATCLGCVTATWTDPAPSNWPAILYYALCYIGQYFIFSIILGAALYGIAKLGRKPLIFIPINALIVGLFLFFFVMNSLVYSVWRYNINSVLFNLGFGPGASQVMTTSYSTFFLIGGIGFACLLVASLLLCLAWRYKERISQRFVQTLLGVFLCCYLLSQGLTIFFSLTGDMRLLPYSDKVPYYNLYSMYNLLDKLGVPLTNTHNQILMGLKSNVAHPSLNNYPAEPLQNTLPEKPLNVLIILVDTWRTDMVSPHYMPHVTSFSQTADRFTQHISGGDCTAPGVFSLFYGLPSVYWNSSIESSITPVMLDQFKKNHYDFAIHISAPITEPPFDHNVFAHFPGLNRETPGNTVLDRDTQITHDMVHFLQQHKETDRPFFGFMFYDALHSASAAPSLTTPFAPSAAINYFTLTNRTDPTPFFNRYKNAAHFDDQLIQRVLSALKQRHLLDNTVVILTGDHGQEYNDYHKNYWEHGDNYAYWQTHTPMIVHWPHHRPHAYHYPTSHFDISTTLLQDVLHVTTPSRAYSVGSNLYQEKDKAPVIISGSYVNNAMIGPDWIVNLYHDGHYLITDKQLRPLPVNTVKDTRFKQALQTIQYYEKKPSRAHSVA